MWLSYIKKTKKKNLKLGPLSHIKPLISYVQFLLSHTLVSNNEYSTYIAFPRHLKGQNYALARCKPFKLIVGNLMVLWETYILIT